MYSTYIKNVDQLINNVYSKHVKNTNTVKIYPNPTKDVINIELVSSNQQSVSFALYDAMGRTVRGVVSKKMESGVNNFQFNLTNLPKGTYYIKINDGEQEINKLIVLE
jgi:flagellar hook assembly protein FlgD